jgi:hypothetical protein
VPEKTMNISTTFLLTFAEHIFTTAFEQYVHLQQTWKYDGKDHHIHSRIRKVASIKGRWL